MSTKLGNLLAHICLQDEVNARCNLTPTDVSRLRALAVAVPAMVEKLSTLTWQDRDIGFNEWRALANVLDDDVPS